MSDATVAAPTTAPANVAAAPIIPLLLQSMPRFTEAAREPTAFRRHVAESLLKIGQVEAVATLSETYPRTQREDEIKGELFVAQ